MKPAGLNWKRDLKRSKPVLEALNEDGSIDLELLKKISRGCLEALKERHAQGKFLGNFHPAQILYAEVDGKIEIEFGEPEVKPMLNEFSFFGSIWMAPEMFQKDAKPTAESDVFTLGLLFFFMLTKRGSPLDINIKFFIGDIQHKMNIDSQQLDALTKDIDTILFIDLINRMIHRIPDQRETCENLIDHAALKSNEERLEIVQHLAAKCFDGDECKNEYLVKIMDKKKVHLKRSLAEDSAEWKELLAETSRLPRNPDIKICSSLLKIFAEQSHHGLLQSIMAALPNFFPYLNKIYREELPKVEERAFKDIFEHFNDKANLLGTGLHGTRVYKGKFQRRPIAIKRVLKDLENIVDREVSTMLQTVRHPNILKYFAKEEGEDFIYIGMELCEGNLGTFIKDHCLKQKMPAKSIFQQTTEGLKHLHQLSIIHRNIKPENILICHNNGTYSVKLADFGISNVLNGTTLSSFNAPETVACFPPEVDEMGHAKSSDVFSLGCVLYFVIFDGSILSKELKMNFIDVEDKLKEKLQLLNDQGNNEQFLQMDLLMKMLNLKPELRPSAKQVLHHPLFWTDKKCFEFIYGIQKIDGNNIAEFWQMPVVKSLRGALDLDKSVIHNDWISKLDATLEQEFNRGYDKESVFDLMRAMRNKWMHKMEQKDVVKDLFGNGTESEYLKYFTAKFPKLLVHCYNAMNDATDLLTENYILYGMECLKLKGSQMTINCADDITFSEMKIELIDTLKIYNSSRLFIEENKSFSNFLQINGSNITQLKFSRGALTFESLDKILQELPNLKEVQFDGVEYEDSKAVLITKCHNLVQSEIWSAESSKLLQAFLECQTMQKLKIQFPKETLEEILQTYPSLEELEVIVEDNYPVSDENEANATTHQLKVLTVELWTNDEKIQEKLVSSILKQNNLQQFNFNSENIFIQKFPQSLCQQLAAHIWQLKRLTSLSISDEIFLQEVEVFVANGRVAWITNLEEFGSNLRYFMSLPSSFLGNFTNLRKLGIDCNEAEETQVEDLISFMNKSKLTSIRLELPPPCFQLLKQLQVGSLQVLDILIDSRYKKVPVFNILQEFLLRHQNITEFKISFCDDYDEPESLELIPRILATLKKLEILKVDKCPKITPGVIEQIAALKTLKFWKINYHSSKNFYKTQNWRS